MINCKILENGDLKITADNSSRAELKYQRKRSGYWGAMAEAFEGYTSNGSFSHFDAGAAIPFVGLTSAPCIAESMCVSDVGENEIQGHLWAFMDYQINDDLGELISTGKVVYQLVESDQS